MKNLVILVIVFLGALQVEANVSVVQLSGLYAQTEETIKYLESHYRNVEAEVIRRDSDLLKLLVAQIEQIGDNSKNLSLKSALSHQMQMTIIRLASEVTKVTVRTVRAVNLRDEVIAKARVLIEQAQEVTKQLQAQQRSQEANMITGDIEQLKKLTSELQVAKAGTTVFMLEKEIAEIEKRLVSEMQRVHPNNDHHADSNATDHVHDHDSQYLLQQGHALVKQLDETIRYLNIHNRVGEVTALQKEESTLKKLVAELESAPGSLSATTVMNQLAAIEHRIAKELDSFQRKESTESVYYDQVHGTHQKEVLLYRAKSLLKQADAAIQQLRSQNRASETTALEQDETLVKHFVAELEAAHANTNLVKLEEELQNAELRLQKELTRLNIHSVNRRQVSSEEPVYYDQVHGTHQKEVLLFRAKSLLNQTDAAIQQLKSQNRAGESTVLAQEEALVKKYVTELESAHTSADLLKLEQELQNAELRLQKELTRLNVHFLQKRDLKKDLLSQGGDLLKKAADSILRLGKVHNLHDSNLIRKEEAQISKFMRELESATDSNLIGKLEHNLRLVELRMTYQLRKANYPHLPQSTNQEYLKQILIQRATILENMAQETIKHLKMNDEFCKDAFQLEVDELSVKKLTKQIADIQDGSSLLQHEQQLTVAENKLSEEISKVYQSQRKESKHFTRSLVVPEEKQNLLLQSEALLRNVRSARAQLKAEGKHELMLALEGAEKFLQEIDTQLRIFHPSTLLGREAQTIFIQLLRQGEEMLQDGLEKLSQHTPNTRDSP